MRATLPNEFRLLQRERCNAGEELVCSRCRQRGRAEIRGKFLSVFFHLGAVVEHMHYDPKVVGSNLARTWLFFLIQYFQIYRL